MSIALYQFPAAFGLPNASPFCMKVETYLRMAGIAYASRYGMYQLRAPKKKLPYIDDGGRIVADSHLIIDYLKSAYGDRLDAALTPAQRAQGTAILRLLEDSLYWTMLYARWIDEPGWSMTRPAFFGALPAPLRGFVPLVARRSLAQQLRAQGIGATSRQDIYAVGSADIGALSLLLGDQRLLPRRRAELGRRRRLRVSREYSGCAAGHAAAPGGEFARQSSGLLRTHARTLLRLSAKPLGHGARVRAREASKMRAIQTTRACP